MSEVQVVVVFVFELSQVALRKESEVVQVLLVDHVRVKVLVDVRHELRPVDIAVALKHRFFQSVANNLHSRSTATFLFLILAVGFEVFFIVLLYFGAENQQQG